MKTNNNSQAPNSNLTVKEFLLGFIKQIVTLDLLKKIMWGLFWMLMPALLISVLNLFQASTLLLKVEWSAEDSIKFTAYLFLYVFLLIGISFCFKQCLKSINGLDKFSFLLPSYFVVFNVLYLQIHFTPLFQSTIVPKDWRLLSFCISWISWTAVLMVVVSQGFKPSLLSHD